MTSRTNKSLLFLAVASAAVVAAISLRTPENASLAQETGPDPHPGAARELSARYVDVAREASRYVVQVLVDRKWRRKPKGAGRMIRDTSFIDLTTGPYSGVIVSADGQILTSDRVLGQFVGKERNGKELPPELWGRGHKIRDIYVTLGDGRTFKAIVMGRNQKYDLAMLKIDAEGLDFIDPTSFQKPYRGEMINIVTRSINPLRYGLASGICSAQQRESGKAFQFDARVGATHLGGLVVNQNAEPLGIVSFFDVKMVGQASGVAFAARPEAIARTSEGLVKGEFTVKPPAPFLGVAAQAAFAGKPGLKVSNVVPGTAAALAGLQEGDLLLQADDVELFETSDLKRVITAKKVGDMMHLRYKRGGEEKEIDVALGARD